jgi:hypothetical protein
MVLSRFDRRIRIVSFRLSEREYRALREFCEANGLRGISDLARRAINGWFVEGGSLNHPATSAGSVAWNGRERRSLNAHSISSHAKSTH